MKISVVGTSHAGFEAIQTLLNEQPEAELHLYERGATASFLSCGIQSYLEGISESLDSLHYATADSYKEQGVHVHMNSDVVAIDPKAKTLTVKTADGEREDSYDKLIVSPGASPIKIPIPGIDLENLYYLRGREWAGKVKERMQTAKKAVVVGAGYIGIEVAEAFVKAGIETTIIDSLDSVLNTYLDQEFTGELQSHATEKGLNIRTGEMVQEIQGENGTVAKVITDKGEYEADTVVMSVGVRPNTKWLEGIVELNQDGTVVIDDYLETSEKDIFAVGDATKIPFAPNHGHKLIALASNARRQGVIAAKNIMDKKVKMPEVSGTSGLSLFDYKLACTGVKDIDKDTVEAEVVSKYVEEKRRPTFMDDEDIVRMKIHFEKDSHRIVGAQLLSTYDVTASINALSVAISSDWTLEKLAMADFFFQPGFSRPWNYLNVLAQKALGENFDNSKL